MPPELIKSYSKNLKVRPEGIAEKVQDSFTFTSFSTGKIFTANHSTINSAQKGGCIEVYEHELMSDSDEYFVEHAFPNAVENSATKTELLDNLLKENIHELSSVCIARFVYKFCEVDIANKTLTGVQIKGANVQKEYAGEGIASEVYDWLSSKFHCLLCDNKQTPEGAGLWAFKMISIYDSVHLYDLNSNSIIGYDESYVMTHNSQPIWSTTTLSVNEIGQLDYPVTVTDCCHDLVFMINKYK